jgi:hypothetical protein
VDVLDLLDNSLQTISLEEVAQKAPPWYQKLVIEHDREAEARMRESGVNRDIIYTTCDTILKNPSLTQAMREMLSTIQENYHYPVDVEFTINFSETGNFLINLVQCRPLQAKGTGAHNVTLPDLPLDRIFLRLYGGAMGGPISMTIDLVAVIDGNGYAKLPYNMKYGVSRAVEAINQYAKTTDKSLMLIGPGRWGTSSPELGVTARFAQLSNVNVLCESSFESEDLMPELSFGSHFFQDLVESDIFYGAIFEKDCVQGKKSIYQLDLLSGLRELYHSIPNSLESYKDIIRVYDASPIKLTLLSNSTSDETVCYAEEYEMLKAKYERYRAE